MALCYIVLRGVMMKTGLIIEGGGMKCSYTAGILDQFLEEGLHFPYVIGVSAGAACAASFLARQEDRNRRFFVEYAQDPRYLSFANFRKTGNYFGLKYIYGELANSDGKDPLDYPAFMANDSEAYFVATDAETGEPHYFSKSDVFQDDYRVFMASSAIPGACKPVKIEDRLYFDGGVSDPLPVRTAVKMGCDRLVVLLCRPYTIVRTEQKVPFLFRRLIRKYPDVLEAIRYRHKYYNDSLQLARKMEAEGRAFILSPSEELPVTTYTTDPALLQSIYETGVSDYNEKYEKLLSFLGNAG